VSKYYEAMSRLKPTDEEERDETIIEESGEAARSNAVVPLPAAHQLLGSLARSDEIRSLCERIAPIAVVENSVRLLVSGCSPGDGATTVAASLAFDLSQRLALETLLVDAHLRHPSLHRLFMRGPRSPEVMLDGGLQLRPTGWPRLELATCCLSDTDAERREVLAQLEDRLGAYPAAVVDLGVTRLDSRMLPLARPGDPILLVVRYGSTRRRDVATTAAALRGTNRTLAGAILNATADSAVHLGRKSRSQ
jgi:Mrp family chromosome partitioning ATPase